MSCGHKTKIYRETVALLRQTGREWTIIDGKKIGVISCSIKGRTCKLIKRLIKRYMEQCTGSDWQFTS